MANACHGGQCLGKYRDKSGVHGGLVVSGVEKTDGMNLSKEPRSTSVLEGLLSGAETSNAGRASGKDRW